MRTVEQQLQLILGSAPRLAPLDVPLLDTLGCVLAADVVARGPAAYAPTYGSAEGFAGADAGTGAGARQVGPDGRVAVGEPSVRVFTNDAGPSVSSDASVAAPIRPVPAAGQVVAPAGALVGEREVAAIVAAGYARARVHPRPRVIIVPVGNGLVESGAALAPGQGHDINGPMLTAAAVLAGADAFRAQPTPENPDTLATIIEDQLVRADLIVVVADTSMADSRPAGIVVDALSSLGNVEFDFAAIDPGPVVAFGTLGSDHVPVIVLPADPASALTNFEVFVRPLIRTLAGRSDVFRPIVRATISAPLNNPHRVRRFIPAVVDLQQAGTTTAIVARPLLAHGPSAVWMREANSLIVVPEDRTDLIPGDQVGLIRLDRG